MASDSLDVDQPRSYFALLDRESQLEILLDEARTRMRDHVAAGPAGAGQLDRGMIHSRTPALLANGAAAVSWALFLLSGALGSVWSMVFITFFFVVPAVATILVLARAAHPAGSTMEILIACLIMADGLGFVLWSPALFLLAQTSDGSGTGRGYLVVLGLLSAAGFALGVRTLVRSGASTHGG